MYNEYIFITLWRETAKEKFGSFNTFFWAAYGHMKYFNNSGFYNCVNAILDGKSGLIVIQPFPSLGIVQCLNFNRFLNLPCKV